MRPSEYYNLIETTLAEDVGLQEIPRIANTYQEDLLDSEAMTALESPGVAICYYFSKTVKNGQAKTNSLKSMGLFTFAVVENLTQHKAFIAANPDVTDYRTKSAMQIAEEVVATMAGSSCLKPCGIARVVEFADPALERVKAEAGKVQVDVNMIMPVRLAKS